MEYENILIHTKQFFILNWFLHDVHFLHFREGVDFFGTRANDLSVVLSCHLGQGMLAIDEAVWQHHRSVVFIQWFPRYVADQP